MVECPICYEDVRIPSCIKPCNHMYCHKCITKWLTKSNKCPLCRKKCKLEYSSLKTETSSYWHSEPDLYVLTRLIGVY